MRIRWRDFELPSRVSVDEKTARPDYAKFIAEPFERGFGTSIGNALRRVLLSSLEGTAVTSVRIEGVQHEFSTLPGVLEDVTEIVLNLKDLLVRFHTDEPKVLRVSKRGEGAVTAADIEHDQNCEIVNPDLRICTLGSDTASFSAEMVVRKGRGYVTAEENIEEDMPIGTIPVDSIFSPVRRVRYSTESTRVGKMTNYDRLVVEVWTDGTVHPEMALVEATKILRKHLNPFVHYYEAGKELQKAVTIEVAPAEGEDQRSVRELLEKPIEDLDLSVRAANCMEVEGIKTIGELCARTEADMLEVRNFGKTSLREIKKKLEERGLELGMEEAKALVASREG
jgi:DNA-directed RNA polymerase subunit alpha